MTNGVVRASLLRAFIVRRVKTNFLAVERQASTRPPNYPVWREQRGFFRAWNFEIAGGFKGVTGRSFSPSQCHAASPLLREFRLACRHNGCDVASDDGLFVCALCCLYFPPSLSPSLSSISPQTPNQITSLGVGDVRKTLLADFSTAKENN